MDEEEKAKEEKEKAEREAAEEKAKKDKEEADAAAESARKEKEKASAPGTRKPFLEEARELDKSIKEGTIKIQELLVKNEKILADALISGKGFAGDVQKPESEDEKWAKDAKIRYAGTGMDPTPDEDDGRTH